MDGVAQRALEQFAEALVDAQWVALGGLQLLATGEGEQLRRELGAAVDGAEGDPHIALRALIGRFQARQQVQVAGDHLEHVVEIVGDAAGEAADRLEFLRLAQALLDLGTRLHLGLDALLELVGQLQQFILGDLAFVDVDQHAGEAQRLALFAELAAAAGEHPQVAAVGLTDAILGPEGHAEGDGCLDLALEVIEIVRMDHLHRPVVRHALLHLLHRQEERLRETRIAGQQVGLQVPDEQAAHGAGVQRQVQALVGVAVGGLGFLAAALGNHPFGGLHHDRHDPGRRTVVARHRAVVEVHPDVFRLAVTQQYQLLVAVGEGAAGQAGVHHVAVEFGDFRPAQLHRRTEQVRMAASGEHRVGVVVDHVAGTAPKHHQRHWRAEQELHGIAQAVRPAFQRPKLGGGPVEGADTLGHLATPALATVALGQEQRRHRITRGVARRPARPVSASSVMKGNNSP